MSKHESVRVTVDIYDLIVKYVKGFPIPKNIASKCNLDNAQCIHVDYSRLQISNKETIYLPSTVGSGTGIPKGPDGVGQKQNSHVLFSSVFTNQTNENQTNRIHTERRTSATCRVSMQKSVSKEGNLSLQIGPPGPVIQANGGFRREVQLSREQEKVFEEELVWSLDTEVIVSPGHRTTAELVITEDEYDGKFRVETVFSGSILIQLRNKRNDRDIYSIRINDLTRVFTSEFGFQPVADQPGAVSFINEGQCHCHFGIGQKVILKEEPI